MRPQTTVREAEVHAAVGPAIEPGTLPRVLEETSPDAFYHADCREVLEACIRLAAEGRYDFADVAGAVGPGGRELLEQSVGVTTGSIAGYARIVEDEHQLRRVHDVGRALAAAPGTGAEALAAARSRLQELLKGREGHSRPRPLRDYGRAFVKQLEGVLESPEGLLGWPTGYPALDRRWGGLVPGNLTVLAARPGMGKTTLALNIALRCPRPVVFYSLEMTGPQLLGKLVSIKGRIGGSAYLAADQLSHQLPRISATIPGLIEEHRIWIDETPQLSPVEALVRAEGVAAEAGEPPLVILDYLQIMRPDERQQTREREIGSISGAMKALAKRLKAPVLLLSQLSRRVEQRDNKRPRIADLRDSGSIEQDADNVLFLYRDEVYYPDEAGNGNVIEAIHSKVRFGAASQTDLLTFLPDQSRVEPYAHDDIDPYRPHNEREDKPKKRRRNLYGEHLDAMEMD